MSVLVVIDDYHQAGATWPDDEDSIATDGPRAVWIERALATHLGAHVTPTRWSADPRQPRALTLAVTGATPQDIDQAAHLYLASAGITYAIREVAA